MRLSGRSLQRTVSFPHEALESDRIITVRGPSALGLPFSSCQSPASIRPLGCWAARPAVTAAMSASVSAVTRTAVLPSGAAMPEEWPLLRPDRHPRINPRRAERRDPAGPEARSEEHTSDLQSG